MITLELTVEQASNVQMLVQNRMKEILELQEQFPDLPMKDPQTWASYQNLSWQLARKLDPRPAA